MAVLYLRENGSQQSTRRVRVRRVSIVADKEQAGRCFPILVQRGFRQFRGDWNRLDGRRLRELAERFAVSPGQGDNRVNLTDGGALKPSPHLAIPIANQPFHTSVCGN